MNLTFLVIDDSKSSRGLNTAYLRHIFDAQATYLEASGGAEALAILASRPVDVALLDLTMPGMSGFEVLAEMQRLGLPTRVIVISADVQRRTLERIEALGAACFVGKPVTLDAVRAVLTKLGVAHE